MGRDETLAMLRAVGMNRALDLSSPALTAAFFDYMKDRSGTAQEVATEFLRFRDNWLANHP